MTVPPSTAGVTVVESSRLGNTTVIPVSAESGETDLTVLLRSMKPELARGQFVFVTVTDIDSLPRLDPFASVVEPEGLSLVLRKGQADQFFLAYDFVAAWIILRVHYSLHAVGLTAAVSAVLARAGISCNVIAGFHHDHLLVPDDRADEALDVLRTSTKTSGQQTT